MARKPIWTLEEARHADRQAAAQGVPYAALLASAGLQLARYVRHIVPGDGRVAILTGPGSNGGDGWVAARHLALTRPVTVVPVAEPRFPDAADWVRAARSAGVEIGQDETALDGVELAVDAIYGTGFHGSVAQSPAARWLTALADRQTPVLHVDMPSGVDTNTGAYDGPRVRSIATLSMGACKWGVVGYPGADYAGQLVAADIGLPTEGQAQWMSPEDAAIWMPKPSPLDHKYRRGRVVVIGGSRSMPGAPILAALAALKSGAGIVEVVVPESARGRVQTSPALIVHGVPEDSAGHLVASAELLHYAARADALVVGPGLGTGVAAAILEALTALGKPGVLDADAIRLLSAMSRGLDGRWVLTPHSGELAVLLGRTSASIDHDRRTAVLDGVRASGYPVHLKGRFALTGAGDGRLWANPTGNVALATAGSGDVLSGMVGYLLAAGLEGPEALALGAYWHGWAGDLGAGAMGLSLTSEDLVRWIGPAAQAIGAGRQPDRVQSW